MNDPIRNTSRRKFLRGLGVLAAAGVLSCSRKAESGESIEPGKASFFEDDGEISWKKVRRSFDLNPDLIHMACLFLASNPKPVRDAINNYKNLLNNNPAACVIEKFDTMNLQVRQAIADFTGVKPDEIALSDSTTMGTGLLINGLRIRQDQEMIFSHFDYYSTKQAIKYQAERTGASSRQIELYDDIQSVTTDEIVENITGEIKLHTRLVAATWVHSSTGLKIPVREVADRIAEINVSRDPADRVIFFCRRRSWFRSRRHFHS